MTQLDDRTLSLPLLYLNSFNMTDAEVAAAQEQLRNKADHVLVFNAAVPAVGLATFVCSTSAVADLVAAESVAPVAMKAGPVVVENEYYSLSFNTDTGLLASITNKASGVSTDLSITWYIVLANIDR